MTEGRTAIAIRIPRPWYTEDEFLEHEIETISRTGILLLGTHSRPQGTMSSAPPRSGSEDLSESTLSMTGEIGVLSSKMLAAAAAQPLSVEPRPPAARDARAAHPPPALPSERPPPGPPPLPALPPPVAAPRIDRREAPSEPEADILTSGWSDPPPQPSLAPRPTAAVAPAAPPEPVPAAAAHLSPAPPPETAVAARRGSSARDALVPPANREELLVRLRTRASALPPDVRARILRTR